MRLNINCIKACIFEREKKRANKKLNCVNSEWVEVLRLFTR